MRDSDELDTVERVLIEAINREPLPGLKLAQQLRIPLATTYNRLISLRGRGLIVYKKVGQLKVYSITEKGRKLIASRSPD